MESDQLHARLSLLSALATVSVMFGLLNLFAPAIQALDFLPKVAAALGSLVATGALYSFLLKVLMWFFTKSLTLRRALLGNSFLEGVWVGHYTYKGVSRYTVEFFDQSDGSTRIQGREFDENFVSRASWNSDAVTVDPKGKVLNYAYTCSVFEQNYTQQGIGHFQIISDRKDGRPTNLDGYAVDVTDGQRDPNFEVKISDERMPDSDIFDLAREHFG